MSECNRFKKLLEHRNREVNYRARELAESARAADRARLNLLQGRRMLQDAACARDDIWRAGATVQILEEVDAWVSSRRRSAEECAVALQVAETEREQHRARLVAARVESKKVERLIERLVPREQHQEGRKARRFEDESAARVARS